MEKQSKERIDLKPLELFCDLTRSDLFPSKKVVVKKTVKVVNTKNHNLSNVTFVTKTTNQNNDMVSIKPKEDNEEKKELSSEIYNGRDLYQVVDNKVNPKTVVILLLVLAIMIAIIIFYCLPMLKDAGLM